MSGTNAPRAELAALQIADPPEAWSALGFTVSPDGVVVLGGVELWLDAAGRGITGWTLRRISLHHDVDGLPTGATTDPPPSPQPHSNGAMGLDHVVVTTPDFDRTAAALDDAGIPLRRVRDVGEIRQGFRRLGPAILEIVEAPKMPAGSRAVLGPGGDRGRPGRRSGRAWRRTSARSGDAVQPGRQIATLSEGAGLSPRIAFMDPE